MQRRYFCSCADGERYDSNFHIHLEDEPGFILSEIVVTLRAPIHFEPLVRDTLREGSVSYTIGFETEDKAV